MTAARDDDLDPLHPGPDDELLLEDGKAYYRPPDLSYHFQPTRPTQGTRAGTSALMRAQTLAGLVRDEGVDTIGAYLDELDRNDLYALAVTLACLTPVDVPVSELLDWMPIPPTATEARRAAERAAARQARTERP